MSRYVNPLHIGVVTIYLSLAILFAWPLPLHMGEAFLGPPASDLGVYVWNLWVFRHEIVAHHAFPFFTGEILSITPGRVPLTLQNYTTFSNVIAFGLLPGAGIVATFNLLTIVNAVMAAYAMFLYALRRTGDAAAACLGGLLFGFSPFMTARSGEHFSLIQVAPLPVFGLLMLRLSQQPNRWLSAAAGLTVAWAFLCDPYYAVYCLLILAFLIGYSVVTVDFRPEPLRRQWWTTLLDIAILCVLGLVVGVLLRGGGRFQFFGIRVSMLRLYTPTLVLTALVGLRIWLLLKPHLHVIWPAWRTPALQAIPAAIALTVVLGPVLFPMFAASSGFPGPGGVYWRSSSPGVDLASYLMPNPFNAWLGSWSEAWLRGRPNGFVENVVSIPWVAILTMVAATVAVRRWAPGRWVVFTTVFMLLSLGPFIVIGGVMTHVPGPWALARYLPIVGAARMPTRLAILVLLGTSMLLAMAVQALRSRVRWPRAVTVAIGLLLVVELAPGQRPLYSAAIPTVYQTIATDPRPVRVLNLPFGLRDGLSSAGNASAEYQYHQTAHEKPLVGGYVSRLPRGEVARFRRSPVMSALMDMSEGRSLTPERRAEVLELVENRAGRLRVGWVVVDARSVSAELEQFAIDAFELTYVERDGPWKLYRSEPPLP